MVNNGVFGDYTPFSQEYTTFYQQGRTDSGSKGRRLVATERAFRADKIRAARTGP